MDLMNFEGLTEKMKNSIDALGKRFLKECGYKITNLNDSRQLARVRNKLERNKKELVYRNKEVNGKEIYFWFELIEKDNDSNILRTSQRLHFTFPELMIGEKEEVESFEVNIDALNAVLNKG